ncbi:MAG TPA: CHAT domain-containing protein [Thermoanaerobaculia bacterium]|nr:CHAT domain-containing protein [Thermoanaerobaculia bacterium]
MCARNLRVPCFAAAVFALGVAAAQPTRQELDLGAALERPLAGGEAHSYSVKAKSGTRLLVTVDQRGIDVVVEVAQADGRTLLAVDSPTGSEGPESALLPDAAGPLEIRVLSPSPGVAPGTYAIHLEEPKEEHVEAERLMTEAASYNRQGGADNKRLAAARYDEAARRWRALGRQMEGARCKLAQGVIATGLGQPEPALKLHQEALALFSGLADEAGQAAAWRGIGQARTALGDTGGAIAAQRQALALARRLGLPYEEGKTLNNLGLAFHSHGDLREALDNYQQALDVFVRIGEQGYWKANVLLNLATVYGSLGEPGAALDSTRQVLDLQRALGDGKGEARTLINLGALHDNFGDFGAALEAYELALDLSRKLGDKLREASLLYNLGTTYYALGDFERALGHYEQALAIRREAGAGKDEVRTEIAIAHARFRLGDTAPALAIGRRAAEAASASSDRQGEMLARLLLGQRLTAGEPAAALAELSRALDLARQLEDRLREVSALQRIGEAHLALEHPEPASQALRQAEDLARAARAPTRLVEVLTSQARAERMLDRTVEARARAEEALRIVETLRTTESDPDLRASFLAAQRAAFEIEIDLLMELERRNPGQGFAQEALAVSERARARSLLDLLQEAQADVREGVDPLLRNRERGLLVRLNAKADQQAVLMSRPVSVERRRAAEEEIESVLDELAQVEAEIRRGSPRYAALTQPPLATAGEIQGMLDGETLLLEYWLGEERSYLWAVDRESVTGIELPPRAQVEAAAREVYSRLGVLTPDDDRFEQAAASLSQTLLGPVAGRLGNRRLLVVADGELGYLPFGALPVPGSGDLTPLLARHEIANAHSISAVALQRRLAGRSPATGTVAVLADPVFDRGDPRLAAQAGNHVAVGGGQRSSASSFLRLPWSRREAQAIAAVVPADRSLVALDFRASRATALSPELSGYRIVHFATHGIIDAQTPALSGLMLSRVDERGAPLEGFLGLRDVYNLRLGADLVVLSGCETALGKQVRGEGLVGLTQGFLYAGARQVVASLWRIEDRATMELMSRFYRGLLVEGLASPAALRRAQLAIRDDKRWRSPYYWSGFVLQGDWADAHSSLR